MNLQIQMIGTGSAFAKKYYNNNALIYKNDYTLLIDCGHTACRALHDLQIPLDRLDAVLITHIHADHIGGLEELAFQLTYVYKRKIRLLLPSAIVDDLWNHSLKGGLENKAEGFHQLSDYFHIVLLEEEQACSLTDRLSVKLLPADHVPNKSCYSVLLNDRIFYSSDSRFDKARLLSLHERGCQTMLHDCQLFSPGAVHASLDELLTLPRPVQEKVWLMHYGDNKEQFEGRTGDMRFIEQGKVYTF